MSESKLISWIEKKRSGHTIAGLKDVISDTEEVAKWEKADIAASSPEKLRDTMRLWQQRIDATKSLANITADSQVAAMLLGENHRIIQDYYYVEKVWDEAKRMKQDPEGNEYLMAAEMCRNEAKYWLAVGALLGNPEIRKRAIGSLDEAIGLAEEGTSVKAVANIERLVVLKSTGSDIDWSELEKNYDLIVDLASHAGGKDRVAAMSWEYIKLNIPGLRIDKVIKGFKGLLRSAGLKKTISYPVKDIIKKGIELSRPFQLKRIKQEIQENLVKEFEVIS